MLHIELRKWADLMIIAPLDANTMAKLVNGICDNLLVSWFFFAHQWQAKCSGFFTCFNKAHLDKLNSRLACGLVGSQVTSLLHKPFPS